MVTLQQLKYFKALAENGHLTRTAEQFFITQTSLSNTIIHLEKQLGFKLFDRVGRSLQLNEVGRQYLVYITQALTALENADAFIMDQREKGEQRVSLTTGNSMVWAGLVQGFQARFRDYTIHQLNSTPDQFRRMLLELSVDFLITGTDDLSLKGLEYEIMRQERLCLCAPKDHPLARQKEVRLEQLADQRIISLPPNLPFRKYCDELFRKARIPCNTVLECDYVLRGQLIEAGFGVGLTTESGKLSGFLGQSNVYVPLDDSVPLRPIAIIWNPARYLSRAARDFRDYTLSLDYPPYAE